MATNRQNPGPSTLRQTLTLGWPSNLLGTIKPEPFWNVAFSVFVLLVFSVFVFAGCEGRDGHRADTVSLKITSPAAGSSVEALPVEFEVETGGSFDISSFNASLTALDGTTEDITGLFSFQSDGMVKAWKNSLSPGNYMLEVTGSGENGSASATANFTVSSLPDLIITPGTIVIRPKRPIIGQPVTIGGTVTNQGPQNSAGTSGKAELVPKLPNLPTIDLGSITIPPLKPLEFFEFELLVEELEGSYKLKITIDPDNTEPESVEDNNSAEEDIDAGQVSDTDLFLQVQTLDSLKDLTVNQGMEVIRFRTFISNTGSQDITYPKLRFSVKDSDTGSILGQAFGNLPGGTAGNCSDGANPDKPVELLPSLVVGETSQIVYEMMFLNGNTNGNYELCVEAIASDNQDPKSWSALQEADAENNFRKISWSVNPVVTFPSTGEITVSQVTFFDDVDPFPQDSGLPLAFADGFKNVRFQLDATDPANLGTVGTRIKFTARGGKADGQILSSSWQTHHIVYQYTDVVIPLPYQGPLAGAPHLDMQIEVTTGTDGTGEKLVDETFNIPVLYNDVATTGISLLPAPPYTRIVPAGGDPLEAVVTVVNMGRTGSQVDVSLSLTSVPQGAEADLGELASSPKQVNIPAGSSLDVSFEWSPTVPTHDLNQNTWYELQTTVTPSESQWPSSDADNSVSEFFPVTESPVLTVVSAFPHETIYNTAAQILKINIYDEADSGQAFNLEVFDELENRVIYSNPQQRLSFKYDTVTGTWDPNRAGYHDLSVRIDNQEVFRHRVHVSPFLHFFDPDSEDEPHITLKVEPERGDYHTITDDFTNDGYYKIYTSADATVFGLNVWTTSQYTKTFRVDDGTNGSTVYNMVLNVPVTFQGVMEEVELPVVGSLSLLPTAEAKASAGLSVRHWNTSFSTMCEDIACGGEMIINKYPIWKGKVDSFLQQAAGDYVSKDYLAQAEFAYELVSMLTPPESLTRILLRVGLSTAAFITDSSSCDFHAHERRNVTVNLPLKNREYYIISLHFHTALMAHLGGEAFADFYGKSDPDCGGDRKGIKMENVTYSILPIPEP